MAITLNLLGDKAALLQGHGRQAWQRLLCFRVNDVRLIANDENIALMRQAEFGVMAKTRPVLLSDAPSF